MPLKRLACSLATIAAAVTSAHAQLVPTIITDGNVSFGYNSFPSSATSSSGSANFRPAAAGPDQVFQSWWYFAVTGDTSGSAFFGDPSASTVVNLNGRQVRFGWADVGTRGLFSASLDVEVYSTGATRGMVRQRMTLTNISANPVTLKLYSYSDVDANGSFGGDTTVQVAGKPAGWHTATDGPFTGYVTAVGYDHYESGPFAALRTSILNGVSSLPYDLSDTLVPGPQDYTGAFQWNLTLAPNASATACAAIGGDFEPPCTTHAAVESYGAAKPGTNGNSAWTVDSPYVGASWQFGISNGLDGFAPFIFVGMGRDRTPTLFGTRLISPELPFIFMAPFVRGVTGMTFPVPNDPVFCNVSVTFQGWFEDPGAAMGVAHTPGLEVTFGSF